jgi:hypothetical protein
LHSVPQKPRATQLRFRYNQTALSKHNQHPRAATISSTAS